MANINFKAGNQKNRKLRRAPSKYQESGGRPNISMSDGIAPAYPAVPYKYLPASFQDINTQDWVVIPKGRLVSMVLSTSTAWTKEWNTGTVGGIADADTGAYNAIELSDDSYFGVSKNIKGLLVPANGGAAQTYQMEANSIGVVPQVGANLMVAAADETLSIGANAPVGCMEHDVYQDIRGANLNYDMRNKNWGVLAQQFIKLPCVDLAKWNDSVSALTVGGEDATTPGAMTTGQFCPDELGNQSSLTAQTPRAHPVVSDSDNTETLTLLPDAGSGIGADAANNIANVIATCVGGGTTTVLIVDDDYTVDLTDGVVVFIGMTGGTNNNIMDTGDVVTFTFDAVDADAGATAPSLASAVYGSAGYAGYNAVRDKFAFLTYNSEISGEGAAGSLLKADAFGNWVGQAQDANSLQMRTQQTAGRLLGIDNRFEKDLLDSVQSRFEDDAAFAVAGAGTYGVPQYLYNFAYASLTGAGWTFAAGKEAASIKELCDAGVFGESWIQLNCQ